MADFLYVCVLLCILIVEGAHKHISGLYCRDPDTGKLYEVNSTWPSESFCGNYTCKLSKRNVTETEYAPIIKLNITDIMFGDEKDEIKSSLGVASNITNQELSIVKERDSTNITDMAISPSEITSTVNNVSSIIKPTIHKSYYIDVEADDTGNNTIDKNDRYLTEPEIKVITEILHTVKKSDLEAIVDVYNLAQEIYNEMESTTGKDELTSGQVNSYRNVNKMPYKDKNVDFYRYDRLRNSKDMKTESTSSSKASRFYSYPATYFRGSYTDKDYRLLPHYYPVSDFHRMLSYVYTIPLKSNNIKGKPFSKQISNDISTPRYTTPIRSTRANIDAKPSPTMLPFPFSNVRHNISDYANNYYNTYKWAQLDMYNKNRYYIPNYLNTFPQASNTFQVGKSSKSEKNMELKIKDINQINKSIEKGAPVKKAEIKKETNKLPEWQTEPLSQKIIEEVRANVMDNMKFLNMFPWKAIQLDRVGKVIKLDELLKPKRQIENDEGDIDYDAQLEKIECETSSDIGFFSYGNLIEPYPACCPKKISAIKK